MNCFESRPFFGQGSLHSFLKGLRKLHWSKILVAQVGNNLEVSI
jgi:hypothetical protein